MEYKLLMMNKHHSYVPVINSHYLRFIDKRHHGRHFCTLGRIQFIPTNISILISLIRMHTVSDEYNYEKAHSNYLFSLHFIDINKVYSISHFCWNVNDTSFRSC